jgi:hypothetical protein
MILRKASLVLVCALFTSITTAGTLVKVPVTIDRTQLRADGNMTSARFSSNEFERIGCGVRTLDYNDGVSIIEYGFCFARTSEEESIMCTTESPNLIRAIRALNDYSYIVFRWGNDEECRYVGSSTQSIYIPGKLK